MQHNKCSRVGRGIQNYAEIGGFGGGLSGYSTRKMQSYMEICNEHYYPEKIFIFCPNVVVRLRTKHDGQNIKFHYKSLTKKSFMSTEYLLKKNVFKLE
ncbi:hypothetical protein BLA29_014340, partial [Euroglyphus maynei]